MCWVCNPYCGACKPPKEKPIQCPECKFYNFPESVVDNRCIKCGAELPEREKIIPVECLYSGLVCARPCGKAKAKPKDDVVRPCGMHTPVDN